MSTAKGIICFFFEHNLPKPRKVMQIYARDHAEVHPQKTKEVLFLVKKKNKQEQRNIMDINCEVLLQEFNEHLLFSMTISAAVSILIIIIFVINIDAITFIIIMISI